LIYISEFQFEESLIIEQSKKGRENEVLKYSAEEDLLRNWANIFYENNRDIEPFE